MRLEYIFGAIAFIILGICIYNQYIITKLLSSDYSPMINYDKDSKAEVSGLYIPNCGYFVDTRGRNIEAINNTEYHEACHALIKQDKEGHYCE